MYTRKHLENVLVLFIENILYPSFLGASLLCKHYAYRTTLHFKVLLCTGPLWRIYAKWRPWKVSMCAFSIELRVFLAQPVHPLFTSFEDNFRLYEVLIWILCYASCSPLQMRNMTWAICMWQQQCRKRQDMAYNTKFIEIRSSCSRSSYNTRSE